MQILLKTVLIFMTLSTVVSCINTKDRANPTPKQTPVVQKNVLLNETDIENINKKLFLIYKEDFAGSEKFDFRLEGVRALERALMQIKKDDLNKDENELSEFINDKQFYILLLNAFPQDFNNGTDSAPHQIDKSVLSQIN